MKAKHWLNQAKQYGIYYIYLILFLLCVYICFGNLDAGAVQHWDEARHGVNAYEMMKEGNFIVNTYNYENDYYNLKPPLSYWTVMAGYKLFGSNVFGLRFFSAFSMVLTFLALGIYMHLRAGRTAAVSSMLFFLTFKELFFEHCARHGDADAVYILFFTVGCLCLMESVRNIHYLYLCGFLFALSFLAKSWHACVLLPIGGLFILFSGLRKRMKVKDWLIFFGAAFLPVLLWAGIRYSYDGTAFLGQMFGVDVTERVTWPESANEDGLFYLRYILKTNAGRLMLLAIFLSGIYLLIRRNKDKGQKLTGVFTPGCLAVVLWVTVTFLTFSLTRADNYWYIFPLYPGLCAGAAFLLQSCANRAKELNRKKAVNLLMLVGAVAVFVTALQTAAGIKNPERSNYLLDLQRALEAHPEYNGLKMYVEKNNNEYKDSFYWEQSGILMAELSGDMKCEEGGAAAYLEEEDKALIILDDYFYGQYRQEFQEDEMIYRNEYIVLKNFPE